MTIEQESPEPNDQGYVAKFNWLNPGETVGLDFKVNRPVMVYAEARSSAVTRGMMLSYDGKVYPLS